MEVLQFGSHVPDEGVDPPTVLGIVEEEQTHGDTRWSRVNQVADELCEEKRIPAPLLPLARDRLMGEPEGCLKRGSAEQGPLPPPAGIDHDGRPLLVDYLDQTILEERAGVEGGSHRPKDRLLSHWGEPRLNLQFGQ
jgi:hypothetical protein